MIKRHLSFFFLFIFIFSMSITGSSSESLINSTCKAMAAANPNVKFGFCATSLQAAPASRCASSRGLGVIAIRGLRYNVTDTRCFVKQLLRSRAWEPYVAQCLRDCLDLYSDAIPAAKLAMRYFSQRRFGDANVQVSSVMDAATTCEDGFAERSGVVSPLTKRNADAFQIGAMALSIMAAVSIPA
ncbi:putative invertase inhibitor [Salvia miltiorrhiza]|uniref:putative invertase inhibitor n=1 Tax=Salvia miltiorrhiza TaxID=226208 RepID=UPI0025AD4652|nr:putative invertase inhibitor [Salvia miltiorrhiza]